MNQFCGLMCWLITIFYAGYVPGWTAILMGISAGSIPWWTMMVLHKRWWVLQNVDDTLGVIHTHGVGEILGGICVSLFAEPTLCNYVGVPVKNSNGVFYRGNGGVQLLKQIVGALFITGWNVVLTTLILMVTPLHMTEGHLLVGDDAEHGEEAYALWGDGEKFDITRHPTTTIGYFNFSICALFTLGWDSDAQLTSTHSHCEITLRMFPISTEF